MNDGSNRIATEAAVMGLIREQYEEKGFLFLEHPSSELLPEFLGNYMPDAVALLGNEKVAIEVKAKRTPSTEKSLQQLAELFSDQSAWSFVAYYLPDFQVESLEISHGDLDDINRRLEAVRSIAAMGLIKEAFILLWPLLEATVRATPFSKTGAKARAPLKPASVISALEEMGLLVFSDAAILRSLVSKRNQLVHGSNSVEVSQAEFDVVVRSLETALNRSAES
jgi:Holliday junction resolvase